MNKIKVEILEGGISCKSVNPLGGKPKEKTFMATKFVTTIEFDKWQQAENERKVYGIDVESFEKSFKDKMNDGVLKVTKVYPSLMKHILKPGSIHEAEVINETTVRVV